MRLTRREFGRVAGASAAVLAVGCGAPSKDKRNGASASSGAAASAKAVSINILDVGGALQLVQGMTDDFKAKHPDVISGITYSKATAPEVVGKIKAQQAANRVDIDVVLTGLDGLASGSQQGLWLDLMPMYAKELAAVANYSDAAAAMYKLAGNTGVTITYYPSGPLLEYMPGKVSTPPTTADELLAWAKTHPKQFQYARPANSGPGRTFLMGLPYILGDKDPKDPLKGWDKTWAFLAELDKYIEAYPSGTTVTMKNLASGAVNMIASTTGWDINPRVLGTVPKEAKITTMKGFHWVTDAHYLVVPKGVPADKQVAIVAMLAHMLTPEQQAKAYDKGYFYPGPAIKDVPLTQAPQASQDVIKEFGRPEYDAMITNIPKETPLDAKNLVAAFDKWDREIGGTKVIKS